MASSHGEASQASLATLRVLYNPRINPLLLDWFRSFDAVEKELFSAQFGYLTSLMDIDVPSGFLDSIVTFWDVGAHVFRFGLCELTPTLEEYSRILRLPLTGGCARSGCGSRKSFLKELLGLKGSHLEPYSVPNIYRCSLGFLMDRFKDDAGYNKHRDDFACTEKMWREKRLWAFALCLLSQLVFPHESHLVDAVLAHLICEMQKGKSLVPVILAETLISLSYCHTHKGSFFRGCSQLLYVWAMGHLSEIQRNCHDKSLISDILPRFCGAILPYDVYSAWMLFFQQLTHGAVVWFAGWTPSEVFFLQARDLCFIPLVGLREVTFYLPCRVLRQFGLRQGVPPVVDMSFYQFESSPETTGRLKGVYALWDTLEVCPIVVGKPDDGVEEGYERWMQSIVHSARPMRRISIHHSAVTAPVNHKDVVVKAESVLQIRIEAMRREKERYEATIASLERQVQSLLYQEAPAVRAERDTLLTELGQARANLAASELESMRLSDEVRQLQGQMIGLEGHVRNLERLLADLDHPFIESFSVRDLEMPTPVPQDPPAFQYLSAFPAPATDD